MSEVFDNLLERAASRYRVLMNDDTIHDSNSPYWEQLRHAKDEYYKLMKARETLMKTGIYDISDEDYFDNHALSKSYLWKLINQTPAHAQVKTQKTDSMAMGSAVHLAVLEPQLASKQIIQGPDTRRGKKWTDAAKEAEADGKILLTQADYNQCMQIRDSVWRNPACASELGHKDTVYEQAAFWDYKGMAFKCKVDAARSGTIIDLKTSIDASPKGFAQAVAKYGYHMQDASYSYGWGKASGTAVEHFLFLVVEKQPPYACAIYELDQISKREGWASYLAAIELHQQCVEDEFFHAYPTEKVLLQLPPYAFKHTNPRVIKLFDNQ